LVKDGRQISAPEPPAFSCSLAPWVNCVIPIINCSGGELKMRVRLALLASIALASAASGVRAAPAPQTSPEAFHDAIKKATTGAAQPCANNEPRDADGICPAVIDGTKGFARFEDKTEASQMAPIHNPGFVGVHHKTAPTHKRKALAAMVESTLADLRIGFRLGSAEITPEGQAQARSLAQALTKADVATTRFEIAGHTDVSGTEERNRTLSQARADAVRDLLVAQGVDKARLETKGYGSSKLALPDSPDAAANRRVEARPIN
jgi:outer membrane protein OmpA-like peptidoglycan-associated protein